MSSILYEDEKIKITDSYMENKTSNPLTIYMEDGDYIMNIAGDDVLNRASYEWEWNTIIDCLDGKDGFNGIDVQDADYYEKELDER